MATDACKTQPDAVATEAMLTLLCVALALFFLATAFAGMYVTCTGPPNLDQSLTMMALASMLCLGSLATLLKIRQEAEEEDNSPLHTTGQLLRWSLRHTPFPLLLHIGGRLSHPPQVDPLYGWLAGGFVAAVVPLLFRPPRQLALVTVLRGAILLSLADARRRCEALKRPDELTFPWACLNVPERFSEQHLLICGATGSGKTVSLRLFLQWLVPLIQPGSEYRLLIYDAKQDALEILSGLPLSCEVIILNPFDARSVAWDIARDATSPATCHQIATILIQDEPGANSFWVKAARDLFEAAMIALHLTRGDDWTFAELLVTLSSTERTRGLLESHVQTRAQAEEHFGRDPKTLSNVQYTITANVAYFRPLAALWLHASRRFSLHEWINGNSILVLGNAEDCLGPIQALNRAIFQRLAELMLAQTESTTRRSWLILDELPDLGHLSMLARLLSKARSKGGRAVLAFQTIEGLWRAYGEQRANDIVGLCASKIFARTDSFITARWASSIIGESECLRRLFSEQDGKNGHSTSWSEQIAKVEAVLPTELMRLPLASPDGFESYCVTPAVGVYHGVTRFMDTLCPKGPEPGFIPRPEDQQYLPAELLADDDVDMEPWSLDHIERMHVRTDPPMWHNDFDDDM